MAHNTSTITSSRRPARPFSELRYQTSRFHVFLRTLLLWRLSYHRPLHHGRLRQYRPDLGVNSATATQVLHRGRRWSYFDTMSASLGSLFTSHGKVRIASWKTNMIALMHYSHHFFDRHNLLMSPPVELAMAISIVRPSRQRHPLLPIDLLASSVGYYILSCSSRRVDCHCQEPAGTSRPVTALRGVHLLRHRRLCA